MMQTDRPPGDKNGPLFSEIQFSEANVHSTLGLNRRDAVSASTLSIPGICVAVTQDLILRVPVLLLTETVSVCPPVEICHRCGVVDAWVDISRW
jgi:hypothetical protein